MDPGLLDTSLARFGIAVTAALVALAVAVWALIRSSRSEQKTERAVERALDRFDVHELADDRSHDELQDRIVPDLRSDFGKHDEAFRKEQEYTRKERGEIHARIDKLNERIARIEGRYNGASPRGR